MGGGLVVYGDLFLLVNAVVDAVLLLVAARLAHVRLHPWRAGLAALLGGLYALGVFYLPGALYGTVGKVLASIMMCWLAAAPVRLAGLFRLLLFFYVASFLTAGLTLGVTDLLGNAAWAGGALGVPWWGLCLALVALGYGVHHLWRQVRSLGAQEGHLLTLCLTCEGRAVSVSALLDTGNQLVDPLTGDAVLLLEREAAAQLLPPALLARLEMAGWRPERLLGEGDDIPWGNRLRLLPFHAVESRGLLLGFRPDEAWILCRGRRTALDRVVVGVTGRLSAAGDYQALLPAATAGLLAS